MTKLCLKLFLIFLRMGRFFVKCFNTLSHLLILFLRCYIAKIFFFSGLHKLSDWPAAIEAFTNYNLPVLSAKTYAYLLTGSELVFSFMIVIGLLTRFAAIPLLAITVFLNYKMGGNEIYLYWMMLIGIIITKGPGILSIDSLICQSMGSCKSQCKKG